MWFVEKAPWLKNISVCQWLLGLSHTSLCLWCFQYSSVLLTPLPRMSLHRPSGQNLSPSVFSPPFPQSSLSQLVNLESLCISLPFSHVPLFLHFKGFSDPIVSVLLLPPSVLTLITSENFWSASLIKLLEWAFYRFVLIKLFLCLNTSHVFPLLLQVDVLTYSIYFLLRSASVCLPLSVLLCFHPHFNSCKSQLVCFTCRYIIPDHQI